MQFKVAALEPSVPTHAILLAWLVLHPLAGYSALGCWPVQLGMPTDDAFELLNGMMILLLGKQLSMWWHSSCLVGILLHMDDCCG